MARRLAWLLVLAAVAVVVVVALVAAPAGAVGRGRTHKHGTSRVVMEDDTETGVDEELYADEDAGFEWKLHRQQVSTSRPDRRANGPARTDTDVSTLTPGRRAGAVLQTLCPCHPP